jgi:hypothetical protein
MPHKFTSQIISAAIAGFEQQKIEIDQQINELRAMLSGGSVEIATTPEAAPGKRKKFSAAARRKMALAQKARWAKIKGEAEPPAPEPATALRAKRKLSAAARAILAANLKKARAAKAAKANGAAVTKKTAPAPKPKRKLSAAGRAAIIAATKKMWATKRAATKEAAKT